MQSGYVSIWWGVGKSAVFSQELLCTFLCVNTVLSKYKAVSILPSKKYKSKNINLPRCSHSYSQQTIYKKVLFLQNQTRKHLKKLHDITRLISSVFSPHQKGFPYLEYHRTKGPEEATTGTDLQSSQCSSLLSVAFAHFPPLHSLGIPLPCADKTLQDGITLVQFCKELFT